MRNRAYFDSIIEFAPSAGWFCLMWLPLAFQYTEFHPTGRFIQFASVTVIAIILLLADWLCFIKAKQRTFFDDQRSVRGFLDLVGLLFIFLVALHLYLMPKIPLLALVVDENATQSSLVLLRHNSAKLLDISPFVKYLFNWILVVFAPIYIVIAVFAGHWFRAISGLFVASFYGAATLAKFPLIMLLITCLFALSVMPTRYRRVLSLVLTAAILIGMVLVAVFVSSSSVDFMRVRPGNVEVAAFAQMKPDDPRQALSYGDNLRLQSNDADLQRSTILSAAVYLLYRIWLTPVDVSNRWYQYFTYVKEKPMGFRGLIPLRDTMMVSPSREVGIWAYTARFPDKYSNTVNAYASFDADAFARGGTLGVFIATLLLMGARIGACFLVTSSAIAFAGYGVLLCGLAILPASASLQAIFGAQGLFLILLGLVVIRVLHNDSLKRKFGGN